MLIMALDPFKICMTGFIFVGAINAVIAIH